MTLFRTNKDVTNTPTEYCEGYIIYADSNISIVAHDMITNIVYTNQKRSGSDSFSGWQTLGNLANLTTTAKDSLVAAVNEVNGKVNTLQIHNGVWGKTTAVEISYVRSFIIQVNGDVLIIGINYTDSISYNEVYNKLGETVTLTKSGTALTITLTREARISVMTW